MSNNLTYISRTNLEDPMQITIDDKIIYFNVQYSNRTKIEMVIDPAGHITVKAPAKTPQEDIFRFLKSNANPLLKLYNKLENREWISSNKSYNHEENFLYLGKPCKLDDLLESIPETDEEIQLQLKKFYIAKTKEIIKKRVKYYEKIIGTKAKSFTIVESSGTWGTCNSLNVLTFNYRLSMAPMSAIDYVVIHELCHTFHMNHDRSFWRKVGSYDLNYKENEDFLKKFGGVMTI